jgi:hypothetical protein
VKGILFLDYVRMLRARKGVDWDRHLPPEDLPYISGQVEPNGWYPMATFERLGNLILLELAANNLDAVRMWGRLSVDHLRSEYPMLVEPGDPVETLGRFRVLRATFFDFEALQVPVLTNEQAQIVISYHMGMPAEEAAAYQTMGFFERLLELSGAIELHAGLPERSWAGDPRTLLDLAWTMRR